MQISVTKKNGNKEEFQIDKIHRIVSWASNGLTDISPSEIEINAKLNIVDGITTEEIHSVLIESAANLISEEMPDYQYVAGRLLNYQLRKNVWGGKNAPKLIDLITRNINSGHYTSNLLKWYTEDEINKIDEFINHEQDFHYTYCSVKQLCDKYLVKNQKTKELFETPQFRYIVAAMTIFHKYEGKKRLQYIKRSYNYFSKFKINLATPQLSGLGTPLNSYASCCLIEMLDDAKSINAVNHAVANATINGYGIGVNYGRMRAIGSSVKNGAVLHPGVVPFLKITEANTKSWQKNGLRGGSATVTFPIWHLEIETILQLKNSTTGTHDSRVFNLDYTISISKLFYERLIANGDITLFSPHETKELYDLFGLDGFDELYCKLEKDKTITKKIVKARELFSLLCKERLETGRIYILNIDNANTYSSWTKKIDSSNLCLEILHNIEPIKDINHKESEIGICNLSAINPLEIHSDEELEKVADVVIRMLDEIIDNQDYFDVAAKNFAQGKRSLGVGITNLAAYLAKHKVKYTDKEALDLVDEWMEKQQYYLIKASVKLAQEKGKCPKYETTKYSQGWLPIDKKFNDEFFEKICNRESKMDWEKLRADIKEHGVRHTTFTAQMPCESSAASQNVMNGIEPARALLTFKGSKKSSIPCLVPNVKSWGKYYELAYDMKDNIGYLNICLVIQKWMDMGISTNQYFSPKHYPDKKIPYAQLLRELLHYYKFGGKTVYYSNSDDQNQHFTEAPKCGDGGCTL